MIFRIRRLKGLGFTIVELLTVLAVMGILVALLIPALNMVRAAAVNAPVLAVGDGRTTSDWGQARRRPQACGLHAAGSSEERPCRGWGLTGPLGPVACATGLYDAAPGGAGVMAGQPGGAITEPISPRWASGSIGASCTPHPTSRI